MVSPSLAREAHSAAQTLLFSGVGHMPQIECPDEFAASVLTFLADAEPTAPPDPERPRAHAARSQTVMPLSRSPSIDLERVQEVCEQLRHR